ncbi:hypothetical protein [Calothrix sp. 336/3]|uniref:hypothetical protein n=1 Tax=Calothrix sp. 336/3 TaxID=1337936 RepID=UPI000552564C|nr:hypothetical protein [Calothrix sp. 336/3]AKG20538.1 hypothetical protein IJ00_03700 [Calothrix sp. 336/3]
MAFIQIAELPSAGSELFNDSESFLDELTEEGVNNIQGGEKSLIIFTLIKTNLSYPTLIYPTLLSRSLVESKYTYSVGISLETKSVIHKF